MKNKKNNPPFIPPPEYRGDAEGRWVIKRIQNEK